jgi:hypothetical protein
MAYKLVDPPTSMCQSEHYMFTTKMHVTIKN